jgi:hypothetical protein
MKVATQDTQVYGFKGQTEFHSSGTRAAAECVYGMVDIFGVRHHRKGDKHSEDSARSYCKFGL